VGELGVELLVERTDPTLRLPVRAVEELLIPAVNRSVVVGGREVNDVHVLCILQEHWEVREVQRAMQIRHSFRFTVTIVVHHTKIVIIEEEGE